MVTGTTCQIVSGHPIGTLPPGVTARNSNEAGQVQGTIVGSARQPVVYGVPVAAPQRSTSGVVTVTNAGPPRAPIIAFAAEPDLPDHELTVLRYRFSMTCFSVIDFVTTLLNILVALAQAAGLSSDDEPGTTTAAPRGTIAMFGVQGSASYVLMFGLLFMAGPVAGIYGARTLYRPAIGIYLVFSVTKMVYIVILVIMVPWTSTLFWAFLIAIVQIWVTQLVGKFWSALGMISRERCKELLDPDVLLNAPVRIVLW